MNDEIQNDRIAELGISPKPNHSNRMILGQTGCVATLDERGIIHIVNAEDQQLFALRSEQIPFAETQLLVVLNVWFVAYTNGQTNKQKEFKDRFGELMKLLF